MQQTVLPFVPGFLFLASNETRRAIVRSFLLQQSPTRIGMLDFGGKDSRPTLTRPRAIGVPKGRGTPKSQAVEETQKIVSALYKRRVGHDGQHDTRTLGAAMISARSV